jgi:hypothetical protein
MKLNAVNVFRFVADTHYLTVTGPCTDFDIFGKIIPFDCEGMIAGRVEGIFNGSKYS